MHYSFMTDATQSKPNATAQCKNSRSHPMPQSVTTPSTSEPLIKKSRFIGCVQPVADRAAAQQVVATLRSQHPAAAAR